MSAQVGRFLVKWKSHRCGSEQGQGNFMRLSGGSDFRPGFETLHCTAHPQRPHPSASGHVNVSECEEQRVKIESVHTRKHRIGPYCWPSIPLSFGKRSEAGDGRLVEKRSAGEACAMG